jgi:hypothetical protein
MCLIFDRPEIGDDGPFLWVFVEVNVNFLDICFIIASTGMWARTMVQAGRLEPHQKVHIEL